VDKIDSIKSRLKEMEFSYVPGPRAAAAISQVTLINIIGPTGVGKSSVNRQITNIDKDFSVPLGFTTRPPRPDEKLKQYRHVPNTAQGWQSLLDKAEAGELVQYTFHSTSDMIYGTEPQDYMTPYAVLDMQFQFVEKTHSLGFRSVKDIAIVANPNDYERQLNEQERLINNESDMEKRRQEGILCLRWCLEHSEDIAWVHNRYGKGRFFERHLI
jgi:guanylate kinase